MHRNTVATIWLGGAVLAVLLYAIGPWDVMQNVWVAVDRVQYLVADSLGFLFRQAFDLVHAVALALFAVFIMLVIAASQRGIRNGGVVGVTALFVGLIAIGGWESRLCWLAALVIALTAAVHMTQRLLTPPARSPWAASDQRRRA